jgi:hypothetical protein
MPEFGKKCNIKMGWMSTPGMDRGRLSINTDSLFDPIARAPTQAVASPKTAPRLKTGSKIENGVEYRFFSTRNHIVYPIIYR